jgi:hypothetical protein
LCISVITLGISGLHFCGSAADPAGVTGDPYFRTPALIAGITCFILGAGLLVFGIIISRRKDQPAVETPADRVQTGNEPKKN